MSPSKDTKMILNFQVTKHLCIQKWITSPTSQTIAVIILQIFAFCILNFPLSFYKNRYLNETYKKEYRFSITFNLLMLWICFLWKYLNLLPFSMFFYVYVYALTFSCNDSFSHKLCPQIVICLKISDNKPFICNSNQ